MQGYKNNISSIIKIGYGSASLGDTAVYNGSIINVGVEREDLCSNIFDL